MTSLPDRPNDDRIGGSLPANALPYVVWRADQELYGALKTWDFCYGFNPRQKGFQTAQQWGARLNFVPVTRANQLAEEAKKQRP